MQRRWTPATLELRSCRDRCSGQRSIQHRTRSPHDRRDHLRGSGLRCVRPRDVNPSDQTPKTTASDPELGIKVVALGMLYGQ